MKKLLLRTLKRPRGSNWTTVSVCTHTHPPPLPKNGWKQSFLACRSRTWRPAARLCLCGPSSCHVAGGSSGPQATSSFAKTGAIPGPAANKTTDMAHTHPLVAKCGSARPQKFPLNQTATWVVPGRHQRGTSKRMSTPSQHRGPCRTVLGERG